jgi:hypothetical protein
MKKKKKNITHNHQFSSAITFLPPPLTSTTTTTPFDLCTRVRRNLRRPDGYGNKCMAVVAVAAVMVFAQQ